MHRKMPALQKEMQASSTSNFRYFTCLLDKGHIKLGWHFLCSFLLTGQPLVAVVPYLQSKCITTCRKFQEHRYKITYHSVTLSSFGNAFSFDNFSISDLSCNFPSFPNIGNSSAVNTLRSASSVSGFNLNSDALTYPELFVKSKMPITAGIFCLKINCFLAAVHYYYSL